MKTFVVLMSVLAVSLGQTIREHNLKCKVEPKPSENPLPKTHWIDIKEECVRLASAQITMEFEAALAYLQLGSYFSQHDVNRPGFAKFFFGASSEERQHGIKVFDYLLMRGQHPTPDLQTLLSSSTDKLVGLDDALKIGNITGLDALNQALDFEVDVTRSIKNMIKACENEDKLSEKDKTLLLTDRESLAPNDYHMVDWLITDLLDEQLKGQRELAGRISTLYKMKKGYGEIADFLYDKTLLEELGA